MIAINEQIPSSGYLIFGSETCQNFMTQWHRIGWYVEMFCRKCRQNRQIGNKWIAEPEYLPESIRYWLLTPGWSTSWTADANIIAICSNSVNTFWKANENLENAWRSLASSPCGLAMLNKSSQIFKVVKVIQITSRTTVGEVRFISPL